MTPIKGIIIGAIICSYLINFYVLYRLIVNDLKNGKSIDFKTNLLVIVFFLLSPLSLWPIVKSMAKDWSDNV